MKWIFLKQTNSSQKDGSEVTQENSTHLLWFHSDMAQEAA